MKGKQPNFLTKSLKNPRLRFILSIFLILCGVYAFFSGISFLFNGDYDYSLIFSRKPAFLSQEIPRNWGGYFGLQIVKIFILKSFGIIGILIPLFVAFTGSTLIFPKARKWLATSFASFVFGLFFFSFFFAFIGNLFGLNTLFWGGAVGWFVIDKITFFLGEIGSFLLLLFLLLLYFLYFATKFPEITKRYFPFIEFIYPDLLEEPPANSTSQTPPTTPPSAPSPASSNLETEEENSPLFPVPVQEFDEEPEDDFIRVVKVIPKNRETEFNSEETSLKTAEQEPSEFPRTNEEEVPPKSFHNIKTSQKKIPQIPDEDFVIEIAEEKDESAIPYEDNLIPISEEEAEPDIPEEHQQTLSGNQVLTEYNPKLELPNFQLPTIDLLRDYDLDGYTISREEVEENKDKIVNTLLEYGIKIQKIKATVGPTITLYEIVPAAGVKVSKIKRLQDDIALRLSAIGIRIIAPMPGRGTIGIEIPNKHPKIVSLKNIMATDVFKNAKASLPLAIGRTISNEVFMVDLAKMPHLLIAGATGQGKSVGINCMITSLLYKKHPSELKFILIDPKKVEMSLYQKIERHYLAAVPGVEESIITDLSNVKKVLLSLTQEMDNRYDLLKKAHCRNLAEYNEKFRKRKLNPEEGHRFLPHIVLIIDELADLMMIAGKEVEPPIARIAQLARAVGIHMIVATQRPSVNVITGTIKANFPARLSYRVISVHDSKTILDMPGAEQLVGKGDLLFFMGAGVERVQNALVTTEEVEKIVAFIASQPGFPEPYWLPEVEEEEIEAKEVDMSKLDPLFAEAARLVVRSQQGSISMLQRKLEIGFSRAGRIMDQLEKAEIVGPQKKKSKSREVLIQDEATLERILMHYISGS